MEQSQFEVFDMKEIWVDVPDYKNLYQVSNIGRIRRMNKYKYSNPYRILKTSIGKDGYIEVCLYKSNQKKYYKLFL